MNYSDSNYNRLLDSISLKITDRVPVFEFWPQSQEIIEYTIQRPLGYKMNSAIAGETSSLKIEDALEYAQRIGMDAIGADFGYWPSQKFKKSKDGNLHYIDGLIKCRDDLEYMERPSDIVKLVERFEYYLDKARGSNIGIYPRISAFFNPAYLAMGINDFSIALFDNYKFVEYLMDYFLEEQLKVMEEICKDKDVKLIHIDDDIAFGTGLIVNREIFHKLYYGRMQSLIKLPKENNILIAYHTDGKLDDILPIFLELGIDAVHPIEPACNDIYNIKDIYRDKICLCGNIDLVLLTYGTKEEIHKDVRKHLDCLKIGGGYVCGSSSSLYNGIPPENYAELVKVVHEYGRYQ